MLDTELYAENSRNSSAAEAAASVSGGGCGMFAHYSIQQIVLTWRAAALCGDICMPKRLAAGVAAAVLPRPPPSNASGIAPVCSSSMHVISHMHKRNAGASSSCVVATIYMPPAAHHRHLQAR